MSGMNSSDEHALDLYLHGKPITETQLRAARLTACDHALGADRTAEVADARDLLEALGLVSHAEPGADSGSTRPTHYRDQYNRPVVRKHGDDVTDTGDTDASDLAGNTEDTDSDEDGGNISVTGALELPWPRAPRDERTNG